MEKIKSLTPEQEARMPYYVQKWTNICLNTEPCNVEESKTCINEIYKVSKLPPPKYFFYFSSPDESAHAIFIVDALSEFSNKYKSKDIVGSTEKWLHIFEGVYKQYSEQYSEPDITWDEDTKKRMLSMVSQSYNANTVNQKLLDIFDHMMYGAHDGAWFSFYDFFLQECNLDCVKDLMASFKLAQNCGWWSAYSEVAFIQDRPCTIKINEQNLLHCTDGPAVEYPNGMKIYALENFWFPEVVVMDPNSITIEMIENEENAEKRRIMLERYGYLEYFKESGAVEIDRDFTVVDYEEKMSMPRMLLETKHGDRFLVGTDGSTRRTYVMPVANRQLAESRIGKIDTCKKAHQLISGLDESKCLAQS